MGFRGVALGTDFNGMSPNIPCSTKAVTYDNDSSNTDPTTKQSSLSSRVFDFRTDGLAHYGMLTDLCLALRQYDDRGADIADYFLMRTAQDAIEMWEKVEQAVGG
jgi:microsomal dipeptidase-like Zn-dependent dipeptidase